MLVEGGAILAKAIAFLRGGEDDLADAPIDHGMARRLNRLVTARETR